MLCWSLGALNLSKPLQIARQVAGQRSPAVAFPVVDAALAAPPHACHKPSTPQIKASNICSSPPGDGPFQVLEPRFCHGNGTKSGCRLDPRSRLIAIQVHSLQPGRLRSSPIRNGCHKAFGAHVHPFLQDVKEAPAALSSEFRAPPSSAPQFRDDTHRLPLKSSF